MENIFFESIKIKNNTILNLDLHLKRVADTFLLYGKNSKTLDHSTLSQILYLQKNSLKDQIQNIVEASLYKLEIDKTYKLKVTYTFLNDLLNLNNYELTTYQIKKINSLRLVHADHICYNAKFLDRSSIDNLFKQKENCDDILIAKNGFITDTSYANIIFLDGSTWVTPNTPLLNGTKRALLIQNQLIKPTSIKIEDINSFKAFKLINALIDPKETSEIEISKITC